MKTSAGKRSEFKLDCLPSKMMNNRVLVKIDIEEGDGRHIPNTKLDLVVGGADMNESAHVLRYGTVVNVPDKLIMRSKWNKDSDAMMDWKTEVDVQQGDLVYFGIMSSANAESIIIDEDKYYVIPYSRLILRLRNDVITMLNGYVLLDEVIERTRVRGLELDFGDFVNKQMGVVKNIGEPNEYYVGSEAMDALVEVGDEVVFERKYYGYLEDDLFAVLPKGTGYCQRCWIIAKLN